MEYDWEVHSEPRIVGPLGELRIPDLVLTKDSSAIVLDVTIRFEYDKDTLSKAANEKSSYYKTYEPQFKAKFRADKVNVFGFPLGARGKWHPPNNKILSILGVPESKIKSLGKLISRRSLLHSIELLGWFQMQVNDPFQLGRLGVLPS